MWIQVEIFAVLLGLLALICVALVQFPGPIKEPDTKHLLLVLGLALALFGIEFAIGPPLLIHDLTTMDPYPPFMVDYAGSFDQFVAQRFPVGSNAQDAITKIRLGGFRGGASEQGLSSFVWFRHAGIRGEIYSIDLRENTDGAIVKISGWKRTRCL